MSASESSLGDKATRLAQSGSLKQQTPAEKLMTPVMSDIERNNSLSPPSNGLAGPLEPLFGMAYLNESVRNDGQTPRKSQSGRNSVLTTPTRHQPLRNTGSFVSRASSRPSTPLLVKNHRLTPREAPISSSGASGQILPTTEFGKSVEQRPDLSPFRVSHTVSPRSASHKGSPMLFASASETNRPSSSQHSYSLTPLVGNNVQSNEARAASISNATGYANEDAESEVEHQMNEEEEIHGLSEAKALYLDRKLPDFVIRKPTDGLTREVTFRPRNKRDDLPVNGELVFEFWDEEQKQGFWTLTDDEGYKWIVKHFLNRQEYRAWLGVESGYDEQGLAFSVKRKQGAGPRKLASQSIVVGESEESEDDMLEIGRTFRKRNIEQIRPYSTEKTNYKRSKNGKNKKNYKTEYIPHGLPSASKASTKASSHQNNNSSRSLPIPRRSSAQINSKSRLPSDSVERKVIPSPTPEPASLEQIQNNTTLYTFTNSEFDAAPGTIYLRSCKDVDSFFAIMPSVAGVGELDIRQITVHFDWLPESKPNTIRMIRGLPDSYEKMMEEIREAPAWKKGGEGRASVFVNVILK